MSNLVPDAPPTTRWSRGCSRSAPRTRPRTSSPRCSCDRRRESWNLPAQERNNGWQLVFLWIEAKILSLITFGFLGAVYTYDFSYDSVYDFSCDSVYDFSYDYVYDFLYDYVYDLLYNSVYDFSYDSVYDHVHDFPLNFNCILFSVMCWQAFVIGVQRIIKTLTYLYTNCARNRRVIRTENRRRVDGP
jgi:hypothetical protein